MQLYPVVSGVVTDELTPVGSLLYLFMLKIKMKTMCIVVNFKFACNTHFSSWGGKREDNNGMYRSRRGGGSSFSAWGGKRNDDELVDYIKAHLAARSRRDDSPIKVIRPARAAFSAWGGK